MASMLEGTPPLDRRAAAEAVERNFVETWLLIADAWGGALHRDGGLPWYTFTGPNEDPRATSVLRVSLADDEADGAIDALLDELRGRGHGSVWWTWRGSRPADIGRRLLARGLEPWPAWPGMALELDHLPPPPVHDDFAVSAVRSGDDYRDVLAILEPLGMRGIFAGAFERIGARLGWDASAPVQHFVVHRRRGGGDLRGGRGGGGSASGLRPGRQPGGAASGCRCAPSVRRAAELGHGLRGVPRHRPDPGLPAAGLRGHAALTPMHGD
jgi:hypothetical protein